MPISFHFELNNKPDKYTTCSLFLRVSQYIKHRRVKIPLLIKKRSDFNVKAKPCKWVKSSELNYEKWNNFLSLELEKANKKYRDLLAAGPVSLDKMADALCAGEVSPSFLDYAANRTKILSDTGVYRTYKKYNDFCAKLKGFLQDKNIRI